MFHAINWEYVGILAVKALAAVALTVLPWVMLYAWFMGVL